MAKPKIKILDHTAKPLHAVYFAARTCYSADSPQSMWRKKAPIDKMQALVLRTVTAGHHSVLEHAMFVFAVSGISRACSHQLVRHRVASFSQQSQRYVKSSAPQYVTPPSIKKQPAISRKYHKAIRDMYGLYREFTEKGIAPEDARFLLPNASSTNLIMTMNLRS